MPTLREFKKRRALRTDWYAIEDCDCLDCVAYRRMIKRRRINERKSKG